MTSAVVVPTPAAHAGALAYAYYYPLVENLHQVRRYVEDGVGANHAGGWNAFSHARVLAGAADTFVTINNDTVYSMAQLDLSAGPLLLEVPASDRYFVLQFVDAWTNNIAYVGTRSTGTGAGRFVIVPPGFEGDLPTGYDPIPASTRILSIVGRTACAGVDDLPGVHAFQDKLALTPVDPAATPAGLPPVAPVPDSVLFWEEARAWSTALPAPDDALAEEYAEFLASAGEDTDALVAAEAEGKMYLEHLTKSVPLPIINTWVVSAHGFDYNSAALGPGTIDDPEWKVEDPFARVSLRAAACRLGLWGNHGYEAVYALTFTDESGQRLDGGSSYTLTFVQAPPVGAFWSLTMYDVPNYYLVENPIGRYSISDRTPGLAYAADRTLTITISAAEPVDPAARANWLPAPTGPFRPVLRMYMPGAPLLDGSYAFPAIRKVL